MRADEFIEPTVGSLLDVGCNVGAWLLDCRKIWPEARLAGVEPNPRTLEIARTRLPDVELYVSGAEALPFGDASFDAVTCIEVLEHVSPEQRRAALGEMRRVLRPGGRLVLEVPHAGWFAFLDSNNVRFLLPKLYALVAGRGLRDAHKREVEWHHHFTLDELLELAGDGFRLAGTRYGALVVYPLADWLSWPFYRAGNPNHWFRRACERAVRWDVRHDYGKASYTVMVALERVD